MGLLLGFLILILCLAVMNNSTMAYLLPPIHAPPPPLSASSPPAPPPLPAPSGPNLRYVRCRSPFYRFCKNVLLQCPPTCPSSCLADCATCKPVCSCNFPGAVCQDPRFVGGDGITFYFHGHKDRDYCLVSDSDVHINGHFIGKSDPTNSRRDFTWVQSIAIMFDDHSLLVAAKHTSTWNDDEDRLTLSLDGHPIFIPTVDGAKWEDDQIVTITRTRSTNGITIEVPNKFRVTAAVVPITKEDTKTHRYGINPEADCFAHLELGFKFFNLTDNVDGVLGQTYRTNYVSKTKVNEAMPVMGGEEKYFTSGVFIADCAVSRFGSTVGKKIINSFVRTLNCKTEGIHGGKGLICK